MTTQYNIEAKAGKFHVWTKRGHWVAECDTHEQARAFVKNAGRHVAADRTELDRLVKAVEAEEKRIENLEAELKAAKRALFNLRRDRDAESKRVTDAASVHELLASGFPADAFELLTRAHERASKVKKLRTGTHHRERSYMMLARLVTRGLVEQGQADDFGHVAYCYLYDANTVLELDGDKTRELRREIWQALQKFGGA